MKHRYSFIVLVSAVVMVLGGSSFTEASAQAIGQRQKPGDPELVRVVGCLEQTAKDWVLTRATAPVESQSPASSEASLKEAETLPLGTQRIRLIGLSVFMADVERAKGHKVEVKGVMIHDPKDRRVNVTSIQSVSEMCAK
jgi:hypothetical protein